MSFRTASAPSRASSASQSCLSNGALQALNLDHTAGCRLTCAWPGRYHLSLFFEERDLALAYAYVTLGSAVSQVRPLEGSYPRCSLLGSGGECARACEAACTA